MLGTIAWHSGPFTGAVESGPKCDADSTVASWLIAVEEAFKGMGEVTSDHSLRVSEHLGGERCLHDAFALQTPSRRMEVSSRSATLLEVAVIAVTMKSQSNATAMVGKGNPVCHVVASSRSHRSSTTSSKAWKWSGGRMRWGHQCDKYRS